jgi:hypothetical protein
MRSEAVRSRRDTYLGIAAATMAVAHLFAVAADIHFIALDRIVFSGSALSEVSWLLQVCGWAALPVVGFAVMAIALIGRRDAREPRLRCGALALAGGYGLMMVGWVLFLLFHYRDPDPLVRGQFTSGIVIQVVAYLAALVAAMLVATASGELRSASAVKAAARNQRLGWAGIGFGVEFTLLLLSGFVTAPVVLDGWNVDFADGASFATIAALAAAVVAAVGFFGAARAYRLPSPDPMLRREGVLAIAATLYLLYRALDLIGLMDLGSWLWKLESIALALAALCAAAGFVVSRRSLLDRDDPLLVTDD